MDEEAQASVGREGKGRRLAAIMFTDIVGYTALAQTDEALALEVLEKHNKLLRPFFPKYRGREVTEKDDASSGAGMEYSLKIFVKVHL